MRERADERNDDCARTRIGIALSGASSLLGERALVAETKELWREGGSEPRGQCAPHVRVGEYAGDDAELVLSAASSIIRPLDS
jgi:hypothetical protein